MGRVAKKLNFLIEEDVGRELENLVPAGKRSRFINDALRRDLEAIRRKMAVEKLLDATAKVRRFSNRDITEGLAMDRGKH